MHMQPKTIILTVFLLCLVLLASCSAKPNNEAGSSKEPFVEETAAPRGSPQFSNEAGTSIDVLREEMVALPSSPAVFGMAYIDYFEDTEESDTGFANWFYNASSHLAKYYPFISEIDEAHTIGKTGHLYCIIAQDYDSAISVNSIKSGELLYHSENGNPILIFSNHDGDAKKADTIVTIKTSNGDEYKWEPTLDDLGHPNILIEDERKLLSWDFTPNSDAGFDLEGWLAKGWSGPTSAGLAYDSDGTDWFFSTWDNSVSYCLNFSLSESDTYDGEVLLEYFYVDDFIVQAQ